ncbi:TPA: hypothetical protein ACSE73_000354 [Acinetobacter baumannii]
MNIDNVLKARKAITNKHGGTKPQKDIFEQMDCPVCESGELHYRVSSYNGHIAARCTSDNCVNWME